MYFFCLQKNSIENTKKIPCYVEKLKSNNKIQFVVSKIEFVVFATKNLHLSLFQNCVFKKEYPFP